VSGTLDETLYVLTDYLDPAAVISTAAAVVERYSYDSFGPYRVLTAAFTSQGSSSCSWNFFYHAQFVDSNTGLYNYGFRFYNADLGRWLSRDPIRERGGLNLYQFVRNQPSRFIDPTGESVVLWGVCAVIVVGIFALGYYNAKKHHKAGADLSDSLRKSENTEDINYPRIELHYLRLEIINSVGQTAADLSTSTPGLTHFGPAASFGIGQAAEDAAMVMGLEAGLSVEQTVITNSAGQQ
jgi:RHS repeat-associated protein